MTITIDNEEYLTAGESAEYLQVSPATFLQWQKQHSLIYKTRRGMGNKKFFKKTDLDSLIQWTEGKTESE